MQAHEGGHEGGTLGRLGQGGTGGGGRTGGVASSTSRASPIFEESRWPSVSGTRWGGGDPAMKAGAEGIAAIAGVSVEEYSWIGTKPSVLPKHATNYQPGQVPGTRRDLPFQCVPDAVRTRCVPVRPDTFPVSPSPRLPVCTSSLCQ